jgi:hypothetical protein
VQELTQEGHELGFQLPELDELENRILILHWNQRARDLLAASQASVRQAKAAAARAKRAQRAPAPLPAAAPTPATPDGGASAPAPPLGDAPAASADVIAGGTDAAEPPAAADGPTGSGVGGGAPEDAACEKATGSGADAGQSKEISAAGDGSGGEAAASNEALSSDIVMAEAPDSAAAGPAAEAAREAPQAGGSPPGVGESLMALLTAGRFTTVTGIAGHWGVGRDRGTGDIRRSPTDDCLIYKGVQVGSGSSFEGI